MSMDVWTKIAQFLLSLSILVVLHELGDLARIARF